MSLSDYEKVRRCLRAELELFATGPGGRFAHWPGVWASVSPSAPDRSLFNAVMVSGSNALVITYDEIAATYDAAGVRAWTVWTDPGDGAVPAVLAARGHVLDASPVAMIASLDAIAAPAIGDLDWSETTDLPTIVRINEAAYGFEGSFSALGALLPGWHAYLARRDGADVACLMCYESHDGDVGIAAVATLPAAQGGGIATRLLAVALERARERGMTTSSLQASTRGRPVYERLGYRDLGTMQMWERRRSRDSN